MRGFRIRSSLSNDPKHPLASGVSRIRLPKSDHGLPTRTRAGNTHSTFARQNSIHISGEADRQTHSDWFACGLHHLCGPFGLLRIPEQLQRN